MKINKPLLVTAAVATVGVSGAMLPALASADANSPTGSSSLVDKIAQKFNLKKEDVQAVFDENKTAHQAERQQKMSDRLQDAVDSGKITAEQKTLIENKLKELQTARETEQKELKAWADQNKIGLKYLMMGHMRGGDSDTSRLDQLVKDGKITAEQKTLIETKQKELQQKRDDARDALKKWAEDNKIDQKYLMHMGGKGHGHRF